MLLFLLFLLNYQHAISMVNWIWDWLSPLLSFCPTITLQHRRAHARNEPVCYLHLGLWPIGEWPQAAEKRRNNGVLNPDWALEHWPEAQRWYFRACFRVWLVSVFFAPLGHSDLQYTVILQRIMIFIMYTGPWAANTKCRITCGRKQLREAKKYATLMTTNLAGKHRLSESKLTSRGWHLITILSTCATPRSLSWVLAHLTGLTADNP